MAQVSCIRCTRVLDYAGDRPSFCAYCGHSLADPASTETTDRPAAAARVPTGPTTSIRGAETVDFEMASPGRSAALLPDRVGGYRLIRQIGRGGMGTVYEAEDSRHGRRVALKVIAPGYVASQAAVERFRREGRLASTLAHPRCVFVLEADEDADGRPYIVMELMTGDTLQDLVEKGGPLAVGDAVVRILDVVDGLREAHRLGLIHRDVKPSNCFLEGDGRVKVGDFGLSKAQLSSAALTRTGSFLGTPLYASPEQIKVEALDGRTDVYSTAATLYYLLTGRAPFDRGDASATMARIVTDPAPSAREKRPEIPAGLDRAIRKGLERDRDRRFADLDEFRAALVPFLPGHIPEPSLAIRAGVYLADYFVIGGLLYASSFLIASAAWNVAIDLLALMAYFTLADGLLGGPPGKWLMRMRVATTDGREPAGLRRGAIRTLVFLPLAEAPVAIVNYVSAPPGWGRPAWFLACLLAEAVGLAALAAPLRTPGRRRALHDLAGRTRVIGLPGEGRRLSASARRPIGRDRGSVTRPVGVMQVVGPYKVRGAVRWEATRRVVAGEDSALGREAWIVLRPRGSPPPVQARRDASRATRPRWLGGGEQTEGRWDAYVAPAGCPLADLAGADGLAWRDARPILEDLADELAAACADGTLPPGLTVDQVWVQPDGRAILVDPLATADPATGPEDPGDDGRALALLRRAAALALEGGRRHADADPASIRSPVPIHASKLLGRLLVGPDPFPTAASFRDDLEATQHLPTEVTRGQRATHLGTLGMFLAIGLLISYLGTYGLLVGDPGPTLPESIRRDPVALGRALVFEGIAFASVAPLIWVAWSFATREGFAARLTGLGLVRPDGRAAPRWRCAWRTLLAWLPPTALLIASVWARGRFPGQPGACWVLFGLAAAVPAVYAALALVFPARGPHDVLSGLRVVPR